MSTRLVLRRLPFRRRPERRIRKWSSFSSLATPISMHQPTRSMVVPRCRRLSRAKRSVLASLNSCCATGPTFQRYPRWLGGSRLSKSPATMTSTSPLTSSPTFATGCSIIMFLSTDRGANQARLSMAPFFRAAKSGTRLYAGYLSLSVMPSSATCGTTRTAAFRMNIRSLGHPSSWPPKEGKPTS